MNFGKSKSDKNFREQFESCDFPISDFNHRAHLRLAYIYLSENDIETSTEFIRNGLKKFLATNGIDIKKYHETMTSAWIQAVNYFMRKTGKYTCSEEFINKNSRLLDTKIILTHYSSALLFSDHARCSYVEPDLDPIP